MELHLVGGETLGLSRPFPQENAPIRCATREGARTCSAFRDCGAIQLRFRRTLCSSCKAVFRCLLEALNVGKPVVLAGEQVLDA